MHDHPAVRNYVQYIHWTIFGGLARGLMQLSCLLLGLGGLQRDRKENTLGFTLALPVSRFSLVASRAALGLLQVLALATVPSLVVTLASHLAGEQLPLDYAVRFIPLWAAGGIFTFAISFLCSIFCRTGMSRSLRRTWLTCSTSLRCAISLSRFPLHAADFAGGIFPHYLDRTTMLWTNSYAFSPIAGFLAAAAILLVLGGMVTAKQDL